MQDLSSKKTVEVRVTPESHMHKIPTEVAQAFATRLKTMVPQALGGVPTSTAAKESPSPAGGAAGTAPPNGRMAQGSRAAGMNGGGRDLQQIIARLPSGTLQDLNLQKGDAVVILATEGTSSTPKTVITLLSGVEPILRAAPSASDAMMLSPWSLGGAPVEMHPSNTDSFASILLIVGVGNNHEAREYLPFALKIISTRRVRFPFCRSEHDRRLRGQVADPSGAAIPGATVIMTPATRDSDREQERRTGELRV